MTDDTRESERASSLCREELDGEYSRASEKRLCRIDREPRGLQQHADALRCEALTRGARHTLRTAVARWRERERERRAKTCNALATKGVHVFLNSSGNEEVHWESSHPPHRYCNLPLCKMLFKAGARPAQVNELGTNQRPTTGRGLQFRWFSRLGETVLELWTIECFGNPRTVLHLLNCPKSESGWKRPSYEQR